MAERFHRRHILGLLGCGAAAATVGGYRLISPPQSTAAPAAATPSSTGWTAGEGAAQASDGAAKLAIVRNGSPSAMVDAALGALGGIGAFVSSGDKVLVKPNIGWDRTPEQAANTNPEVVARLVELSLGAGAKRVTVMDYTCNDARRCYTNSGIQAAAEAAGARVLHVDSERVTTVDIGGEVIREWDVFDEMLDADVRINVPVAKHHSLSRVSLGMKNWMGCAAGHRPRMHQKINVSIVDLAAYFRPSVTLIDAYRILIANGPTGGRLADVRQANTLCASTDPVAADTFGASLFGIGPDDLHSLTLGEERGLGTRQLDSLPLREIDLGSGA